MYKKTIYTDEDRQWLRKFIVDLKAKNAFNFPGIRESGLLEAYTSRFKKQISIEGLISVLNRIDNPELSKQQYLKYKENKKLRKQGILPSKGKSQNIGELLSRYPFIIVIENKVAGYETEEQVKKAIINSQVPTNLIKMFEVKERKIKSQVLVDIE